MNETAPYATHPIPSVSRRAAADFRQTVLVAGAILILAAATVVVLIRHFRPPTDREVLFQNGLKALTESRWTVAANCVDSLAALPEGASHARALKGALRLRRGDSRGALREFSQVDPEGDVRHPLLQFTGEALYNVGRLHDATRVFRELAAERPNNPEPHRWLGAVYYDLGIRERAIAELESAARLSPADHRPLRLLALIYYDFQQYADAARYCRRALELHGAADQPDIVQELGHCLVELRQFDEAVTLLVGTDDPELLALRADASLSLGHGAQAQTDLARALELRPDAVGANLLQARIELAAGNAEAAIDHLRRVMVAAPHHRAAQYELANALRQAGREREADEQLAALQETARLDERYVELAERAAQQPYDAVVRRELAKVCQMLGHHQAAASWSRAADACEGIRPVVEIPAHR